MSYCKTCGVMFPEGSCCGAAMSNPHRDHEEEYRFDLEPCPFCGKRHVQVGTSADGHAYVLCEGCCHVEVWGANRPTAISNWNGRKAPVPPDYLFDVMAWVGEIERAVRKARGPDDDGSEDVAEVVHRIIAAASGYPLIIGTVRHGMSAQPDPNPDA